MVQWSPRFPTHVWAELVWLQSASALCLSGLRPVMCREERQRARDLQTPECTLLVQLISSQL